MSDRNHLVDPKTGRKYPVGGCLISGKPSDAPKFGAIRNVGTKDLPPGVDLRQFMTPIEDQSDTYACVANALAGAYEFLIMKNTRQHVDFSRLFIYYNSRLIDGLQDYNMQDRGSYISSGIKALALYGCCKEDIFPYRKDLINRRPPKECYDQAKKYRISESMNVDVKLDEMKACLAQGYPFAFGLELCQSFMNAGSNRGRVQTPHPYEQQAAQHGWHAMLAVGYSDPSRCFIVRNSWGTIWGDEGYCYIPYDYMANPKRCQDLHCIRTVTDESRFEPDRKIHNRYDWNSEKKNADNVPPDYPYPDFHHKYFWQYRNVFNYFNAIYHNGHIIPFVWGIMGEGEQTNSSSKLVVYIDQQHEGMIWVRNEILSYDKSIQFESCETMQEAENFLSKNKDSFRSLTHFQIITRGFYQDEKKNALNLLDFLITKRINNAQVFVFTQDRKGVEQHFEKQAPTFHLPDWRRKLIIVSAADELVENMKKSLEKK